MTGFLYKFKHCSVLILEQSEGGRWLGNLHVFDTRCQPLSLFAFYKSESTKIANI